jgi:hypothetical protein
MKLDLILNNNPIQSKPKSGHLSLVSSAKKDGSTFKITEYVFQIFSPDKSIEVIQRTGSWKEFMSHMETVSFQSLNREMAYDDIKKAYILACSKISPVLAGGDLGNIHRLSLLLPSEKEYPILLSHDNSAYFNRPISNFVFFKQA